ncbi:hypothetical protein SCP_1203950 [Sparassis crispa]|uniref:Uncharacterized protein n=1 Tax=Sparassis crispa TaxID=139825 RepID=A0A401H161_9APHY|nr:hypothetical protein SCP_1203950 [Sparassis crispa]GBE88165.1 hypothetical protein SCP_1203950 [Sparassis crispa]
MPSSTPSLLSCDDFFYPSLSIYGSVVGGDGCFGWLTCCSGYTESDTAFANSVQLPATPPRTVHDTDPTVP